MPPLQSTAGLDLRNYRAMGLLDGIGTKSGQGVAAAAAAGTNNQVISKSLTSGVNGDIIPVLVAPSMLQG